MVTKRRKFPKVDGKILKSGLEVNAYEILKNQSRSYKYEPFKHKYTMVKEYTPDFVIQGDYGEIWLECKGRFRLNDPPPKYIAIRHWLPSHTKLVFVLQNPNAKYRTGISTTMGGWCDKNEFEWVSIKDLPHKLEEITKSVFI